MDKVIMLPTDFSIESLNTLRLAADQYKGQKIHVVLVYAETPSDSITDLLFYRPVNTIKALKSKSFEEALSVVRNRYESTIASLSFKIFNGTNTNALLNFVEANQIDDIILPTNYNFQFPKNGFDMTPMIKKSKLPYREIGWDSSAGISEQLQINVLFNIN